MAIDSAPAEGVRVTPVSQVRSLFPILRNPANRHRAVGFTGVRGSRILRSSR